MKACLAWGQVKMTLIPAPGKANCTEAVGYHPINLLFCMQKIMKKLLARISGISHWVYVHVHIYQSAYKPGKSTKTAMHHVISHIQEAVDNR
jgi:hypothetical protein